MMEEIITDGWLKGEIIRDGTIINSQTNRRAFMKDITNTNTVKRLRERGHVGMVSEYDEKEKAGEEQARQRDG